MIISDLNYLEDATQDVVGGTFSYTPTFGFNNSYQISGTSLTGSGILVGGLYGVASGVTGNSASIGGDNQAFGSSTNTQTTFSQVVTPFSSQQSISVIALAAP
ncbi:hypothetical protein PCC9214_03115 [Planktothrix tepida]|uniref:Uncharacterized protein n=1 Tax=Planktothrix tepida PCC 9214 TaxID=671072 RepID=A0A1J1LQ67_9CYAN|nr:hypothetical protein [Planktothrix tepida]CAD5959871.1 hypothetical protein PCC9214_03115 [Planktothrix tepida]CUR34667.1 conserved hypothetical protein [Planktothrix tepida PCC 9214]